MASTIARHGGPAHVDERFEQFGSLRHGVFSPYAVQGDDHPFLFIMRESVGAARGGVGGG